MTRETTDTIEVEITERRQDPVDGGEAYYRAEPLDYQIPQCGYHKRVFGIGATPEAAVRDLQMTLEAVGVTGSHLVVIS